MSKCTTPKMFVILLFLVPRGFRKLQKARGAIPTNRHPHPGFPVVVFVYLSFSLSFDVWVPDFQFFVFKLGFSIPRSLRERILS